MKMATGEAQDRAVMTREEASRLLVLAVLATAVEDIVTGREHAAWLSGAACRHWCEWVDLEPAAVRRDVERRLGSGRRRKGELSGEQMAWAVEVHERGLPWSQAAAALGVSHHTLRVALKRAGLRTDYRTDRADRKRPVVLDGGV